MTVTMTTQPKVTDPGVGVLLTVAGWTGGGVMTGIVLHAAALSGSANPLDAFYAVVAGCFLVGPLVAGALLWRWRQPRPVGTVAILCGIGVLGVVPLMASVTALVDHRAALVGILLFVVAWGVALPAGTRALVLASSNEALARDFDDDLVIDLRDDVPLTSLLPPTAWQQVATDRVPQPVGGPPVDPNLPPAYIPNERWGSGSAF